VLRSLLQSLRNLNPANNDSRWTQPGAPDGGNSRNERRDLLKLVLRETLAGSGFPKGVIKAELLASMPSGGPEAFHVRFVWCRWEPDVLLRSKGFEDAFVARLAAFDPESRKWLKGCSWRYALGEGATYPALVKPDRPAR
jgi:hypothetical protein